MKIRVYFLLCIANVALVAVVAALLPALDDWRRLRLADKAVVAADAFGATMRVAEAIALERGVYNQALSAEAPAAAGATQPRTVATDDALKTAQARVAGLVSEFPDAALGAEIDALRRLAASLAELRGAADRALALPRTARDAALVTGYLGRINALGDDVDQVVTRLERVAVTV